MNSQNWTGRFIRNETSGHWNPRNPVTPVESTADKIKGWLVIVAFSCIIAAMLAFSI